MIKIFFSNSLMYILCNILTKGISFFLLPVYTRLLSPNEYGILDLFTVLASIINLVITFEISQALARYYHDASDDLQRRMYTSTSFLFTVAMYLVYVVISCVFSEQFSFWLLDSKNKEEIFILASIFIASSGIFYFIQNHLKWRIMPKAIVFTSILNSIIATFITIFLLFTTNLKVESIFIGQIIGCVIGSVVGIYSAKLDYGIVFSYTKLKEMIAFSFPLVFSGIGIFIGANIDRMAIKNFIGLDELGIYGVAYRIASISSLVIVGFQQALTPLVYKHYLESDTHVNISKIFNIFCLLMICIVTGSILFSKEILFIFTTKNYYAASSSIPILTLSIFLAGMYIFAPGISIAKKTYLTVIVTAIFALLNIILNWIFVPKLASLGAAFGTLISSGASFFIYVFLSYKYYPIHYSLIKIVFTCIMIFSFSYIIIYFLNEISLFNMVAKILFLFIIFIVVYALVVKVG
ncbi:oligosaccharide flippase family protein [Campylobacter concisus]|jgi:polysaccharide biosynthesis protein